MRNLTREAALLAEKELVLQYPQLANRDFRQRLNPIQKFQVFNELNMLAELFLQNLEGEINAKN